MRKITLRAISSFYMNKPFKQDNTQVRVGTLKGNPITELLLHDNVIAKTMDGRLWITASGWLTPTTKERLNGFTQVYIVQWKGVWYLKGKEWDGSWIEVL